MTTILVTGGAGFVGSHVACGLAGAHPDVEVVALDNLHRRGSELNLARLHRAGVRFVHGDVRVPSDWPALRAGPDIIVDCAAEPSVLSGIRESPRYVVESNLFGSYQCCEYARQHSSAIILLSTSRVYPIVHLSALPLKDLAERLDLPREFVGTGVSFEGVSEDFPLNGTRSLYGGTKLASELLLEEYAAAYGLPTIVNRCGTITGPGQMGKVEQGVFALWMAAHYFQQPLTYIGYGGQGKQVRDFLHVADLVALVDWQVRHIPRVAGSTWNVGGGRDNSLSLAEMTALCQRVTGHSVPEQSQPADRPNDVPWYVTDIARVREATGWRPTRDTETMAKDIYRWLRESERELAAVFFGAGAATERQP